MVADAAYFRAERRGFSGDPTADWLAAEAEVDAMLREMPGKSLHEELEERLAAANTKLRSIKRKVSAMKAEAREEWTHDVEKLARLRDRFKIKLDEIREQGEHASEKAKRQADKIWHEISEIVERAGARRKSRRAP
jgi:cytochrome c556